MLVVQGTDRLARGDGVKAQHLIEVVLWARKSGVTIRSVQDDATSENLVMAVVMGERNHEDSRRKALATASRRRAAERGEWCGPVPDGYLIERTPDGAAITRRVVMDPERREVYLRIWDMAIAGATVNEIVRELAARGYRTAPAARRAPPPAVRRDAGEQGDRQPLLRRTDRKQGREDRRWPLARLCATGGLAPAAAGTPRTCPTQAEPGRPAAHGAACAARQMRVRRGDDPAAQWHAEGRHPPAHLHVQSAHARSRGVFGAAVRCRAGRADRSRRPGEAPRRRGRVGGCVSRGP
jgi:hypothetical protein